MSVPHRLGPDTPISDNLAYANDNFDKLVSDLGDMGYQTAFVAVSTGVLGPFVDAFSVEILDNNPKFTHGIRNVICAVGLYEQAGGIFRDGDSNYRMTSGSLVSSHAQTVVFSMYQTQISNIGTNNLFQAYPINSVSAQPDGSGGTEFTPIYRDGLFPSTYNTTRVGVVNFNLYYKDAVLINFSTNILIAYLPITIR